jgi:NADPH:quinone reductase-like Zn-dependent oxidoreductase
VNPKTENFWVIDYRIFDPETDGLSKLDHVEEMLRSAEHRRMALRTVLCSDGSCVSPTWDKSSEGGSMMNEPAVEPGRTMEALRAQARGGPEKLIYERVLPPSPGIGDVLLKVRAASFIPTELDWSSTWVDRAGNARPAPIPAHEVSGVVAALGYGTTGFAVGDEVYGLTDWYRDGAAAGYVAVEARNLAPKPHSLDHERAAAVPLAALTAWQALFDHGGLSAGQSVLIHGAGGGVGVFAVQLARSAGARVIATGRAWAEDLVGELGADEFVDIDHRGFEDVAGEVDVVFDLVGGEIRERSWAVVKPGGVLVSVVSPPEEAGRPGARGVFFVVEPDRAALAELARRIDAGELRSIVGEVFPLEHGREAFEAKRRSGVPGKVVLQVAR